MPRPQQKSLNKFLEDHIGILTMLGLFMIFLGASSNKIFPPINDTIDFSSGSTFIWLSFMLIVITCILILIKDSWDYGKPSVALFGSFLLIAFIPLVIYLIISVLLSKDIMGSVNLFPRSIFVSVLVMLPLFIIILVGKIRIKSLRISLHVIFILLAIISIISRGSIFNVSNDLSTLKPITWGAMSIIISYLFKAYYLIRDRNQ